MINLFTDKDIIDQQLEFVCHFWKWSKLISNKSKLPIIFIHERKKLTQHSKIVGYNLTQKKFSTNIG